MRLVRGSVNIETASHDSAISSRSPVQYPHAQIGFGEPVEVANGIWWLRLPIALAMDHVNVYVLEDKDELVLVDTGCNSGDCRATLLETLTRPPFADRPISRVIATHFHPDHIGLAGYFAERHGARLLTSRTAWHVARLLRDDNPELPHPEHIEFMQRVGMKGMDLESFKRREPGRFSDKVDPLPRSYQRLREFDNLAIGDRVWNVRTGDGHADEHILLWSDDNIALVGDQILPAISPNLSVHFSEPKADCVGDWIESCKKFRDIADDTTLCLPGHNRPFTGAPGRCEQLIENCEQVCSRILDSLATPRTAIELMPTVYRRELGSYERNLLFGEIAAYLNRLFSAGEVTRRLSASGAYRWARSQNRK